LLLSTTALFAFPAFASHPHCPTLLALFFTSARFPSSHCHTAHIAQFFSNSVAIGCRRVLVRVSHSGVRSSAHPDPLKQNEEIKTTGVPFVFEM
jgi:hypothetical protein